MTHAYLHMKDLHFKMFKNAQFRFALSLPVSEISANLGFFKFDFVCMVAILNYREHLADVVRQGQNQYIPDRIWGYNYREHHPE